VVISPQAGELLKITNLSGINYDNEEQGVLETW
jgi:hypothetical protein